MITKIKLAVLTLATVSGLALGTVCAAPVGQASAATAAAAASAKLSVQDTPIETLAANPQAKAVVEKYLPNLFKHPSYESFKSSTLADLQPYSGGHITDDSLKSIQAGLDQIK